MLHPRNSVPSAARRVILSLALAGIAVESAGCRTPAGLADLAPHAGPVSANLSDTQSTTAPRPTDPADTLSPAVTGVQTVAYQDGEHTADAASEIVVDSPVELVSPLSSIAEHIAAEQVPAPEGLEAVDSSGEPAFPIDLATALRLAGAGHLQIALATERIREANARLDQANVLWVPTLNVGVGYNRHDGPLQDTSGDIVDVSRQSLYFGGGPAIGNGPLSGGASGPARLFVELPTANVLFEPLAARQNVRAAGHARRASQNDNVLQVGLAYQQLVRAQLQIGIAEEAIVNAEELVRLTTSFAEAGQGLVADAQRASAELQQRRGERAAAQEQAAVASAELGRLLRLNVTTQLLPVESQPLPIEFVCTTEMPIELLIQQGLTRRPELAEHQARVAETMARIQQEQWRPWLPHMFVGYGAAGFGGGRNSDMQDFDIRGDLDVLAVWQVRNMGMGNRALQRERASQNRQARMQFEWIRDQVIAEIAQAYSRVQYRRQQIIFAEQQIIAAADALPLNFNGIHDGVIRPIEAQQSIAALAAARSLYLAAVIDFNQAQLELVRALGDLPSEPTYDRTSPE